MNNKSKKILISNDILKKFKQKIFIVESQYPYLILSNNLKFHRQFIYNLIEKDNYIKKFDYIIQDDVNHIERRNIYKPPVWNKGLTKETSDSVLKYSQSLTGRTLSESHKRNMYKFPKGNDPWNKGLTKDEHPSLKKFSECRMGEGNPMWGHNHSDEYKKERSDWLKKRIENGEWTPQVRNYYTHSRSIMLGKKFRSSWEAMFYKLNNHLEYETLRIPYINENNENHIYIVDFVDHKNKNVFEIKPSVQMSKENNILKKESLLSWCENNGYAYFDISEKYFYIYKDVINNLELSDDNEIDILRRIKDVIKKYENKINKENQ